MIFSLSPFYRNFSWMVNPWWHVYRRIIRSGQWGQGENGTYNASPRIFGISLRRALIVTAGRHSQLLCLLSWRDVLIPREERNRRWIGGWVPWEEGRIVSRSRGCIVPRIVCPIVWHHGPITADKASAMLKLWGCIRDRIARFRARTREKDIKRKI